MATVDRSRMAAHPTCSSQSSEPGPQATSAALLHLEQAEKGAVGTALLGEKVPSEPQSP